MSGLRIRFRLLHLFIAMTLIAVAVGGTSFIFESQNVAKRNAAQAAARAVEVGHLLNEITHRAGLARSCWMNNPQRASDYLNGTVSGDTTDLALYRLPLATLLDRLAILNYDFKGTNLEQLEDLAHRLDPTKLPELLLLVDRACRP